MTIDTQKPEELPRPPLDLEAVQSAIKKNTLLALVSATIGNAVEWADWAMYGLTAPFIAANFFPKGNPTVALIQAYGLFALGYLMRPLGAFILGPYGDKHGRKKALAFSIIFMALGTGAIGFLPTYQMIGYWAPFLVLLFRMIQGIAAGGEWGSATAFLYEFSPKGREAFLSSFRPASAGLGFFIGSLIVTVVTSIMSTGTLNAWGWRVPFIVGLIIGGIGLYIRLYVDETPKFKEAQEKKEISEHPLKEIAAGPIKPLMVMFGLVFIWNSVYGVIYTYVPAYLSTIVHIPISIAMQTNSITLLFYAVVIPVIGWFSDRYSKILFIQISALGLILFAIPGFIWLRSGTYTAILGVQMVFALLIACFAGPATAVISELFPIRTRNSAVSITQAINASLFGGTAPMTVAWLVSSTGNNLAAAYYVMACALIAYISILQVKRKPDGYLYITTSSIAK